MFHEDLGKPLKDAEKIESIREGQTMQSMDKQPEGQTGNEAPSQPWQKAQASEAGQQTYQEPTSEPVQGRQLNQITPGPEENQGGAEGQGKSYQGVSEHIPFSFPPAPYRAGSVQPEAQPVWPYQPAPTPVYPPPPAHYQASASGRLLPPPGPSLTQSGPVATPEQLAQAPTSPDLHRTAYQRPANSTSPPGLPATGTTQQPGLLVPAPAKQRRSGLRTGAIVALGFLLAAIFASGLVSGWALSRNNGGLFSSDPNSNAFQPGKSSTVIVPALNGSNADAVREAVISKVQPSIVQIDVMTNSQHALGSGVIIDGRGYIVTNNHVVTGANSIQVTLSDGSTYPAEVRGTDSVDDLAVIKITPPTTGLTVVSFGDSSQVKVGQAVLAIGSPLGNAETVTSGIVSALNRNVSEGDNGPTLPDAVQTDAPINPGNSGGALVDMQGYLIGIPTLNAINTEFNTPANGVGFAIPANRIKNIAQQIIADGHVSHTGRAMLGVSVTSVTQSLQMQDNLSVNSGVLVMKVNSGSPAETAGFQVNDVIVQLDNAAVYNTSGLSTALLQHKPGESVAVKIYRGSQQLTLNVNLGELAAS